MGRNILINRLIIKNGVPPPVNRLTATNPARMNVKRDNDNKKKPDVWRRWNYEADKDTANGRRAKKGNQSYYSDRNNGRD